MMLEPSIDELMDRVNSKYMLVTLSAKRARELQNVSSANKDDVHSRKYVGQALREIADRKLSVEMDAED
ncbi:MAG TPA: DNA-directed RNA polymerase subunit omega [Bacillales bacterium]|nr:DNA-directed RNA polymerase subunit omega [Bacillales bacterium]